MAIVNARANAIFATRPLTGKIIEFTFLDELGVEPLGFISKEQIAYDGDIGEAKHRIGSNIPYIIQTVTIAVGSKHRVNSSRPDMGKDIYVYPDNKHYVKSTIITKFDITLVVYKAKHMLPTVNKNNAPVEFVCDRYLNTPYEDKILQTPLKNC